MRVVYSRKFLTNPGELNKDDGNRKLGIKAEQRSEHDRHKWCSAVASKGLAEGQSTVTASYEDRTPAIHSTGLYPINHLMVCMMHACMYDIYDA